MIGHLTNENNNISRFFFSLPLFLSSYLPLFLSFLTSCFVQEGKITLNGPRLHLSHDDESDYYYNYYRMKLIYVKRLNL